MNIENLIEALRNSPVFDTTTIGNEAADAIEALQAKNERMQTELQNSITRRQEQMASADFAVASLKVERDTLLQQLAEVQALIEASRKQKAVGWLVEFENGEQELHFHDSNNSLGETQTALYAAPVVADDVQRYSELYLWLRDNSASISWNPSRYNSEIVSGFSYSGTGYLGFSFEDAIKEAMGGAND